MMINKGVKSTPLTYLFIFHGGSPHNWLHVRTLIQTVLELFVNYLLIDVQLVLWLPPGAFARDRFTDLYFADLPALFVFLILLGGMMLFPPIAEWTPKIREHDLDSLIASCLLDVDNTIGTNLRHHHLRAHPRICIPENQVNILIVCKRLGLSTLIVSKFVALNLIDFQTSFRSLFHLQGLMIISATLNVLTFMWHKLSDLSRQAHNLFHDLVQLQLRLNHIYEGTYV